jgi:hypothetical protein
VKEELDIAKAQEIETGNVKIIPLLYEKCVVPDPLKSKLYADFTSSFERGMAQILRLVRPRGIGISPVSDDRIGDAVALCKVLRDLYRIATLGTEEDEREEALEDMANLVRALGVFAQECSADRRCFQWLTEFETLVREGLSVDNVDSIRKMQVLWLKGKPLLRGGIARGLSLKARAAFEVGKDAVREAERNFPLMPLEILTPDLVADRPGLDYWHDQSQTLSEDLGLSDSFNSFVSEAVSSDTIIQAFILEMLRQEDDGKLEEFIRRRQLADAVLAGLYSILLFGLVPGSGLTPADTEDKLRFIMLSSFVADCIVTELAGVGEAERYVAMIPDALGVLNPRSSRVLVDEILNLQSELARLCHETFPYHSAGAFRLGMLLGWVDVFIAGPPSEQIEGSHIALEAEKILKRMNLEAGLLEEIRTSFNRLFGYEGGGREPHRVAEALAESLRVGRSRSRES